MASLRRAAEWAVELVVRRVRHSRGGRRGGRRAEDGQPAAQLQKGLTLAADLFRRFGETRLEVDNVRVRLTGGSFHPGP